MFGSEIDLKPGDDYLVSGMYASIERNPNGSNFRLRFGKRRYPVTRVIKVGDGVEISYRINGKVRRAPITPSPLK